MGSASVTITGGTAVAVYGGGWAGNSSQDNVTGAATVSLSGNAEVSGGVYGGGYTVSGGTSTAGSKTVTVGGGVKIGGSTAKGIVINGGTASVSNGVGSFVIADDLTESASVNVQLPAGYDIASNPTIATSAVEADLSKIKLVGGGAEGNEAYFENNEIKVREKAPASYTVTVGTTTNGTVIASTTSATAGMEVTLTVNPDSGYQLDALTVYKTGNTSTTVTVSNNKFTMPSYDVTVSATFKKTADQTAVDSAKAIIEGGSYSVAQATANSADDVKIWLATTINNLSGMSTTDVTVQASNITVSDFIAAQADTTGSDGSFKFTVSLSKNGAAATTTSKVGTITKTPYNPPQQSNAKRITGFAIPGDVDPTTINHINHTIAVLTPAGTNVTSLTPTITVSDKASVSPASGTPQNFTSPVAYTVTAEDGTKQIYTVTATVAPTITTQTLPGGTVGSAYSQTLAADGTAPVVWSVSEGSLPGGLTLNASTGVISGIPTTAGTSTFTVKASNAADSATKQLSITIAAPTPAVTGVTVSPGTATVQKGTTQQFSATVAGTNSPAQTVTWSVTGGKTGTSITSGLLTVASDETAVTLTVTATSTVDATKSGTATVTVTDTPVTRYTLTVTNGTGGGSFEAGANLAITANAPANGKVFDQWTSADGVRFADANSAATTITMPASDTAVTANYKDSSVDTSAIDTAISAANEAKSGVTISDSPASSVLKGTKFVTAAQMQALNDAISAAQAAKGTVATAAEAEAAARALDAAIATFKAAIKTGTYTSGSGDSGSSGGSGGGNGNNNGGATTPPTDTGTTTDTTQAEVKVDGKVDGKVDESGNAAAISEKAVEDAIKKAEDEAKKNGTSNNGVTLVLNVTTGGKTANSVTVNLPKATQEMIIDKKIVNTVIVVDNPNIRVGMDLSTIREINRQAQADVNITAARMDNGRLTGDAKAAIGSRPVFDLSASYGTNRVQNFGAGTVCITIPYTLQKGEAAGGLYAVYVDSSGNVSYITNSSYDAQAGLLRFATNHFSVYGIGYKAPANFTDIANHWAKTDIEFAVNRGLMNGSSNTTFSPDGSMTRGMFVTALGRLAGVNTDGYKTGRFTDVKADAYYGALCELGGGKGIVSGTTTTTFAPDQAISRQEMAVIMSNYAKALGYKVPKTRTAVTFADHGSIGSWAADVVKQMQMAGILNGKDGNRFDPTGTATRAEVAAVLHRYVELVIDPATAQGWDKNDSGVWMYYENGKPVTGEKAIDGTTYHFDAKGLLIKIDAVAPDTKKYITHKIVYGDTLWDLAQLHHCTVSEIVSINNIKNPNSIPSGTEIKIPQE